MDSTASRLRKGAWSEEEDDRLRKCIWAYGEGKWHLIPERAGLNSCRKSCRQRWLNYLTPDIRRGNFGEDEDELIIRLHRLLGNKWSLIAGRLPGRTANDVKNYWNSHLQKRLRARGEGSIEGEAPKPILYKGRGATTGLSSKAPQPKITAQDIQIRDDQNVRASSSVSVATASHHDKQCFSDFFACYRIGEGEISTFSGIGEEMITGITDIDNCMQEGQNVSPEFSCDTGLWNLETFPW